MARVLDSFRSTLQVLGFVDGMLYVMDRMLSRISRDRMRVIKYNLVVQPINDGIGLSGRRCDGVVIREILEGDPLLDTMGHEPETMVWRFRQNARCLAALKSGGLVGFLWWIEGPYSEDEVRCRFVPEPKGEAVWDFDVYVCPRNRLSPVFSCLWDEASRRLHAAGYRYTCSRISVFNPGSLASHRRLGSYVVGSRVFIRLGLLELSWGSQEPHFCVSFGSTTMPEISVSP